MAAAAFPLMMFLEMTEKSIACGAPLTCVEDSVQCSGPGSSELTGQGEADHKEGEDFLGWWEP